MIKGRVPSTNCSVPEMIDSCPLMSLLQECFKGGGVGIVSLAVVIRIFFHFDDFLGEHKSRNDSTPGVADNRKCFVFACQIRMNVAPARMLESVMFSILLHRLGNCLGILLGLMSLCSTDNYLRAQSRISSNCHSTILRNVNE